MIHRSPGFESSLYTNSLVIGCSVIKLRGSLVELLTDATNLIQFRSTLSNQSNTNHNEKNLNYLCASSK